MRKLRAMTTGSLSEALYSLSHLKNPVKELKYVYLSYFKLTKEAFQSFLKDPSIISNWMDKVGELCKKQEVKLLILGSPYGLEEQLIVGIETDLAVDEFTTLKGELYRIDPKFIEYSKTTIIIQ